jgi:hypothetical protein
VSTCKGPLPWGWLVAAARVAGDDGVGLGGSGRRQGAQREREREEIGKPEAILFLPSDGYNAPIFNYL